MDLLRFKFLDWNEQSKSGPSNAAVNGSNLLRNSSREELISSREESVSRSDPFIFFNIRAV